MNVNFENQCRICLKSDTEAKLEESSLCIKFFSIILDVEVWDHKHLLCIWCKSAVKKTMDLINMAKESHILINNSYINGLEHNPMKRIHDFKCHYKNNFDATFTHSYCSDSVNDKYDTYLSKKTSDYETINFISINDIADELDSDICDKDKETLIEKTKETTSEEMTAIESIQKDIIPNEIIENFSTSNETTEKELTLSKINLLKKKRLMLNIDKDLQKNKKLKYTEIKKINHKVSKKKEIDYKEFNFQLKYLTKEDQINELVNKKQSLKYIQMKYHCDKCSLGFITRDVFDEHLKRHDKFAGPHICETCTLRFKSKEVLSHHTLCHRRRFICLLCDNSFTRWSHCLVHRQKCGGVQSPAVCGVCGKMFSNDQSLRIHIKGVHECERKHACDQCGKRFTSKQRLTVHMRTHTGVKEFECSKCSQRFSTHSNLRAHAAVHDNAKTHYCVECNTFYKTLKGLKRHFKESVRHVVKDCFAYPCQRCTKSFETQESLNKHTFRIHLTANICGVCKKSFSSKTNLRKHVKSIHAAK